MLVMRIMGAELSQRLLPALRKEKPRPLRQMVIGASADNCASMRRLTRRMVVRLRAAAHKLINTDDAHAAADAAHRVRAGQLQGLMRRTPVNAGLSLPGSRCCCAYPAAAICGCGQQPDGLPRQEARVHVGLLI